MSHINVHTTAVFNILLVVRVQLRPSSCHLLRTEDVRDRTMALIELRHTPVLVIRSDPSHHGRSRARDYLVRPAHLVKADAMVTIGMRATIEVGQEAVV